MNLYNIKTTAFLFSIVILFSCQREDYYTGSDAKIEVSTDTLRFDTVFTSIGSSTKFFKIYNKQSQPILIDVALKNNSNNTFRINVDGVKGPNVAQVEINSQDSIYVFVETTINPDLPLSISPFIINDAINITYNGNLQTIILEAWGQNANYIPNNQGKGGVRLLTCGSGTITWDDPKPYVIYGVLAIDSCTVVLPPGCRIYVHGGIVRTSTSVYGDGLIVMQPNGILNSQGTTDQPVIIQGDRLEEDFNDVRSQWEGIVFTTGSTNHHIDHTIIKNCNYGLFVDSLASIKVTNSIIYNTGNSGIIGKHAAIIAENCLIYSNNNHSVRLFHGGDYEFNSCTVVSNTNKASALFISDFYVYNILRPALFNKLKASFTNTIFAGNDDNELIFAKSTSDKMQYDYQLNNCVVKVRDIPKDIDYKDFIDNCANCIIQGFNSRVFKNENRSDYSLDSLSIARNKGIPISTLTRDIKGKHRKNPPDIGCYEF